jgi:hypothetical protein
VGSIPPFGNDSYFLFEPFEPTGIEKRFFYVGNLGLEQQSTLSIAKNFIMTDQLPKKTVQCSLTHSHSSSRKKQRQA